MSELEIIPTGAALGAEVRGLDLSVDLLPDVVETLQDAFLEYSVLIYRGQQLSQTQQVHFTNYFGKPVPHVREQPDQEIPEIFVISNVAERGVSIGALGNSELPFHSDLSYMPEPGTISILYAVEVPPSGGDTSWASSYAAYDALSADLQNELRLLRAVHRHDREQQNPPEPAAQPIIRKHPLTDRKVLYVNPQFTRFIVGMEAIESEGLLKRLFQHVTDARFVYTHQWRPGDLVMWDNRCTMHRRESLDNKDRRIMWRTQMFGEAPIT